MKKTLSLFTVLFTLLFFNAQNVLKVEYESVMTPNLGNIKLSEESKRALAKKNLPNLKSNYYIVLKGTLFLRIRI